MVKKLVSIFLLILFFLVLSSCVKKPHHLICSNDKETVRYIYNDKDVIAYYYNGKKTDEEVLKLVKDNVKRDGGIHSFVLKTEKELKEFGYICVKK